MGARLRNGRVPMRRRRASSSSYRCPTLICVGWGLGCVTVGPFLWLLQPPNSNIGCSSSLSEPLLHKLQHMVQPDTPAVVEPQIRASLRRHDSSSQQQNSTTSSSPYAYAFVIGGCDPQYRPSYQNYLYDILVATKILRERGSTADVVALLQVTASSSLRRLPDSDMRLLHSLGVHVYYIPSQTTGQESFYRTQLDKFRILGLTEYQRILFMDGDIMPLANLDYLFEMSVAGILRENLVLQGTYEPASGGFFMLEPGHLPQVNDIIRRREQTGKTLAYPHFDNVTGWGQVLTADDPWVSTTERGTNYTFLAAFADQGLLFHYTKYARKSVSIVLRTGKVENWVADESTTQLSNNVANIQRMKKQVLHRPFAKSRSQSNRLDIPGKHNLGGTPMDSIVHFTGKMKPWIGGPPQELNNATQFDSVRHFWFWQLMQLDKELQMGLDFEKRFQGKQRRPPLGLWPKPEQILHAESNLLTPLERDYPPSLKRPPA